MKKRCMRAVRTMVLTILAFMAAVGVHGQNERKVIRQGIRAYEEGAFDEAETRFRMAEDINNRSFAAAFNTGAALYNQDKYEETVRQYEDLVGQTGTPEDLAHVWHNMGNSLLEAKQYGASIEAYKNSLRLNPSDQDTKYNLAYARKKLEEQQQQQNQDQDQQNQDQDQQNQNQDQQNQDQQNQDQQDQQQQDQQQARDQEQQQEPQPLEISREDAERVLSAIQQQEKDVKNKVDKQKAAAAKVKTEKDW